MRVREDRSGKAKFRELDGVKIDAVWRGEAAFEWSRVWSGMAESKWDSLVQLRHGTS